ncbi:MAG: efflux RND transporter periplasmic adaptor subunit [Deltaproteobacteria bacterium]|nr:MAG: efflux RND transporter periplasmic adaptor subunit [Deltaproteobacteria bacterium]
MAADTLAPLVTTVTPELDDPTMPIRRRVRRARWAPLAAALVLSACGPRPAPAPPPPKVKVVQAVAREITEWDEYTARLDAIDSVEVRPRVSGYLQSIHFQDGAIVHKGDLLFLIDPRPYEAALRRAEADVDLAESRLALARKNFARAADLLASHAISQEESDIRASNLRQAEASVEEAQAAVDAARLDVEFTRVSAPVAGRVGRKLVTEGNLINGGVGTQGTLLTTIVSLDPIYAYFEADEGALLKYSRLARTGQRPSSRDYKNPVHVALADEEGFPHEGVMDFVDNQVDRGTGTIVGRALLPNPDLSLIPGLFARLRLPGSGRYRAILLPDEAIGSDQSQKFVFVVDGDSKAQYRTVKIGPLVDGLRVVREGVTSEDWVVVAGLQRVRPGLNVDAQRETIPSAESGEATTSTTAAPGDRR